MSRHTRPQFRGTARAKHPGGYPQKMLNRKQLVGGSAISSQCSNQSVIASWTRRAYDPRRKSVSLNVWIEANK
jgi:hypothetical protein